MLELGLVLGMLGFGNGGCWYSGFWIGGLMFCCELIGGGMVLISDGEVFSLFYLEITSGFFISLGTVFMRMELFALIAFFFAY